MKKLFALAFIVVGLSFACTAPKKAELKANDVCPMSGQPVDDGQFVEYQDMRIYTCCEKCLVEVKADPAAAADKAFPNN